MTDWSFDLKLRCGCTNGIPAGSWLICPQHDCPEIVAHVRKAYHAEFWWNFEPPKRSWVRNHDDLEFW